VGTGAIPEMMAMRKSLPLPEIEPQELNRFYGTYVNKTAA
jgi:hypothetical protein